jgi:hypothetical protein
MTSRDDPEIVPEQWTGYGRPPPTHMRKIRIQVEPAAVRGARVGAGTRRTSRDLLIFVDEAGEPVEPLHATYVGSSLFWERM